VEKQGELVTREEIVRRLWGDNGFVDTRHGINTVVHNFAPPYGTTRNSHAFWRRWLAKGTGLLPQSQHRRWTM
jgi:hypothetical protein